MIINIYFFWSSSILIITCCNKEWWWQQYDVLMHYIVCKSHSNSIKNMIIPTQNICGDVICYYKQITSVVYTDVWMEIIIHLYLNKN